MAFVVNGGAGLMGGNLVLDSLAKSHEPVVSLDALTYTGNREKLLSADVDIRDIFAHGNIGDLDVVSHLLARHRPHAMLNSVAEPHAGLSLHGPEGFIQTNIVGTFHLLVEVRAYYGQLSEREKKAFRSLLIAKVRYGTSPAVPTNIGSANNMEQHRE